MCEAYIRLPLKVARNSIADFSLSSVSARSWDTWVDEVSVLKFNDENQQKAEVLAQKLRDGEMKNGAKGRPTRGMPQAPVPMFPPSTSLIFSSSVHSCKEEKERRRQGTISPRNVFFDMQILF
jgi:hypothetical protein